MHASMPNAPQPATPHLPTHLPTDLPPGLAGIPLVDQAVQHT
jgi:hypothetical protein